MQNNLKSRTSESLENELSNYKLTHNSDFFFIIAVICCAFCFMGIGELFKIPFGFKVPLFFIGALVGIFVAGFTIQKLTPDNIKEVEQELENRKRLTI